MKERSEGSIGVILIPLPLATLSFFFNYMLYFLQGVEGYVQGSSSFSILTITL